jgi:hypothetical protein
MSTVSNNWIVPSANPTQPTTVSAGQGIGVSQSGPDYQVSTTFDPDFIVEELNSLVGSIDLLPGSGISVANDTIAGTITVSTIKPYFATYYKSVQQNLISGNTDMTFDLAGSWNNDGGFITHVSGSKDFVVVLGGFYQLSFNATIQVSGATWSTTTNRNIGIDITRPPSGEQAIIQNSALQGVQNYTQATSGYYYLIAGDIINLRVGNTFTGGPPHAEGVSANLADLNTFFTWTFIST